MFRCVSVSKSLSNMFHSRDALFYAMTGRTFDGKKAAEMKFVNYSVPLARLEAETMAVARELAPKNPAALRGCKDGHPLRLEMRKEAPKSYTPAKQHEGFVVQKGARVQNGIGHIRQG